MRECYDYDLATLNPVNQVKRKALQRNRAMDRVQGSSHLGKLTYKRAGSLDVVHEFLPKTEDSIIEIGRSSVQLFPSSGKKFQFHRRASVALISANTVSAGIVFTSPASKSPLRR